MKVDKEPVGKRHCKKWGLSGLVIICVYRKYNCLKRAYKWSGLLNKKQRGATGGRGEK